MTGFQILTDPGDAFDWRDHDPARARERLADTLPPPSLTDHGAGARAYRPDPELVRAVNAAIHLRAPLLLTGEPGTGKTQLAWFLGLWFGIPVFPFTVRSTSSAMDLRYDFDAVAYLRDAYLAQAGAGGSGCGIAIDTDNDTDNDNDNDDDNDNDNDNDNDTDNDIDFGSRAEPHPDRDPRMRHIRPGPLWRAFVHPDPCIVLIDEIDKAPRDFPNDLLQELDQQRFPHPFSQDPAHDIRARPDRRPLVLVTSNNERRLPDAFLRRSLVHHIVMTPELIGRAVAAHGAAYPELDAPVRTAAIARFRDLRAQDRLSRRPGIAELLAWLVTLARARPDLGAAELERTPLGALPHLHCLVKDQDDLAILQESGRR